jgi:outer membrane protein OmpA-like peptidoglycan-associated protein
MLGDLYVSYLQDDQWSIPESLGPNINTEYRETHAAISIDGQTLYFTSERPGGSGGSDIYMSELQEDGSWGSATNLGDAINSELNEEGPYIHPSDTVMYFSSNGHKGMGGYDLFMSIKGKDGVWKEPKNIGYPLNSPDDDVFFISSPEGNYGFYASNQYGSTGSTNIYTLKLPSQFKNNLAVIAGNIVLNDGTGGTTYGDVSIKVIDNTTGDTIRNYKPDPINGLYALVLPTPNEYTIIYEAYGHLPQVETISLTNEADLYNVKKVLPLQPIIFGATGQSYTVKFDPNTSELTYEGDATLKNMVTTINDYDELVAQVVLPFKDDLLLNQQKETILSYLYRNVIDTTRIKIIEKATDENFEVFLADTSFLNFNKTKWLIVFDDKEEIESISEYKLRQIAYYMKNDNSLCVQIPIYKSMEVAINEERAQAIYDFLISEEPSISKQIIVWEVPKDIIPLNDNSLELVITDKYPGAITLIDVIADLVAQNPDSDKNKPCILADKPAETIVMTLYFDFAKYIVDDISETEDVIDCLKKNNEIIIELKGHTDEIGSYELNYQLGLKRAEYIKQFFVKQGVPENQIVFSSEGEAKPIAPNKLNNMDNPEGRKLNRRVELIVKKNALSLL